MLDDKLDTAGTDLELEVGGGEPELELRHLVSVSSTFANLVNEVAERYTGTSKPVRWLVDVQPGCVRLPLRARPAHDSVRPSAVREIPSVIADGIAQLEREPVRPEFFNDKALEQVRALANAGVPLAVRNGGERVNFSAQSAANVEKVLGKVHESYGTVEGGLEELTIHGSKEFGIWQPHGKVRCLFGRYVTLEDVLQGVGKRVAARGTIRHRPRVGAISVEVESLRILDADDVSAESVLGLCRGSEVADW